MFAVLCAVTLSSSSAHAEDPGHGLTAPLLDEMVRALLRLPGIGVVLEPVIRPVTPSQAETRHVPTMHIAPTFTLSSLGVRAIATF